LERKKAESSAAAVTECICQNLPYKSLYIFIERENLQQNLQQQQSQNASAKICHINLYIFL
jgi:hypothetical protein